MKRGKRTMLRRRFEVAWFYRNNHAAVSKGIISFGRAPAVYYYLSGARCRRSYNTAGAHAERKYAAAIHLLNKTVRCRRKQLITLLVMILDAINQRLWMLYAHPKCKGL